MRNGLERAERPWRRSRSRAPEDYLVGRAGVDTIGQPRFVHGGVSVRFGG